MRSRKIPKYRLHKPSDVVGAQHDVAGLDVSVGHAGDVGGMKGSCGSFY